MTDGLCVQPDGLCHRGARCGSCFLAMGTARYGLTPLVRSKTTSQHETRKDIFSLHNYEKNGPISYHFHHNIIAFCEELQHFRLGPVGLWPLGGMESAWSDWERVNEKRIAWGLRWRWFEGS